MKEKASDPFKALMSLRERVQEWLHDDPSALSGLSDELANQWSPATDVVETDDQVLVAVELPGLLREELTVQLDGNQLTIRGRRPSSRDKGGKVLQLERQSGEIIRVVQLPEKIEEDKIQSHLANGLLTITLAKKKPRQISVG